MKQRGFIVKMKLLVIFKVNFAAKLGLQLPGLQNPFGPARQQAAPPSGFKDALLKLDLEIWMRGHGNTHE